jgi:hypothetical protein
VRVNAPSFLSRLNHPLVPGVLSLLAWTGYVVARWQVWAKGHLNLFVVVGTKYTHRHQLPPGLMIADYHAAGYDGQFYYRLALNPLNWSKTAYGISMDQSYRYTRIGYPFLAWLGSFGQHDLVPASLIAVNLVCVGAMAALGGMFARDGGRHALWGLLFAAYFGLAISMGRDTAEPLAEACLLAGLLAYRRNRWVLSAAAFAFGALTRETILFAPAAIALVRLYSIVRGRVRPGLPDLVWVAPAVAYGAIELAARVALKGEFPVLSDNSRNLATPFTALIDALRYDAARINTSHLGPWDISLLEYATLALFILAGLLVIVVTQAPVHERIAFVFFVLELGLLSSQIWMSVFGDGRSLIEPYLFALIMLFATPKRYLNTYRLVAIAEIAVPALVVVVRRRILFM